MVTIWQTRVGDGWRYADPELAAVAAYFNPGSVRLVSVKEQRPRWRREPKPPAQAVTPRRLACARRALDRQANAVPLFSNLVRAEQPTPEERIALIDAQWDERVQGLRNLSAEHWREGRAILRSLPRARRALIVLAWNAHGCPATGTYFVDFVSHKAKEMQ